MDVLEQIRKRLFFEWKGKSYLGIKGEQSSDLWLGPMQIIQEFEDLKTTWLSPTTLECFV
jgi:hypothetical protein